MAAGTLSAPQAAVIADAAVADASAAPTLLAAAEAMSLAELRDECGRRKAAALDVAENERRIHARRSLREYVDAEGAWHLHAVGTVAAGARVRAVLEPLTERRFIQARRAGMREPREAYAFDALVELAEEGADSKRRSDPRHLGLIRADLQTLRRGVVEGDEVCEIAGFGPVSVPAALDLFPDAVLKLVLTRGVDVVNVTHLGRGLNVPQQIAQLWEQPGCTTLGCPRRARLQNDHRTPYAECRTTTLANNDPLCCHCHDLKTYDGWALTDGSGRRPLVGPDDPRHPNNANAPPKEPAA